MLTFLIASPYIWEDKEDQQFLEVLFLITEAKAKSTIWSPDSCFSKEKLISHLYM